jgi:hypothetical protein
MAGDLPDHLAVVDNQATAHFFPQLFAAKRPNTKEINGNR